MLALAPFMAEAVAVLVWVASASLLGWVLVYAVNFLRRAIS